MVYRLYRGEDFLQLYAIELECFKPPFRFARGYMRQLVESRDSATWIAEEQGRMTGFAIAVWIPKKKQDRKFLKTKKAHSASCEPTHRTETETSDGWGTVSFPAGRRSQWMTDTEQTIAYIQTLEVAPEHRRRGIGKRLLRHLEISARNAGAETVWLHVAEQNPSAIRLYQAHGYFPQGREEDYYAAGAHALTYAKALPKSRTKTPA